MSLTVFWGSFLQERKVYFAHRLSILTYRFNIEIINFTVNRSTPYRWHPYNIHTTDIELQQQLFTCQCESCPPSRQADPRNYDGDKVCLSESPPCHQLSLLESSPKRSIFLTFVKSECQKKLLLSEFPVWSDGPIIFLERRGGGRIHFDMCTTGQLSATTFSYEWKQSVAN